MLLHVDVGFSFHVYNLGHFCNFQCEEIARERLVAHLKDAREIAVAQFLDRLKLVYVERALFHFPRDVLDGAIIRLTLGLVTALPVLSLAILRAIKHLFAHRALLGAGLPAHCASRAHGGSTFRFHHFTT